MIHVYAHNLRAAKTKFWNENFLNRIQNRTFIGKLAECLVSKGIDQTREAVKRKKRTPSFCHTKTNKKIRVNSDSWAEIWRCVQHHWMLPFRLNLPYAPQASMHARTL